MSMFSGMKWWQLGLLGAAAATAAYFAAPALATAFGPSAGGMAAGASAAAPTMMGMAPEVAAMAPMVGGVAAEAAPMAAAPLAGGGMGVFEAGSAQLASPSLWQMAEQSVMPAAKAAGGSLLKGAGGALGAGLATSMLTPTPKVPSYDAGTPAQVTATQSPGTNISPLFDENKPKDPTMTPYGGMAGFSLPDGNADLDNMMKRRSGGFAV